MMIAKVLLEFLNLIHKNEELIRTIKHILQVFPEAVLIQTYDEKTKKIVIKFANDAAKRDILNYDSALRNSAFSDENSHHSFDLLDQPVVDENLNYTFSEVENWDKSNSNLQLPSPAENMHLSELLETHVDAIMSGENEVVTSVQMTHLNPSVEPKHFNAKTVKVKWESCQQSFIHVFVSTTYVKNYEKEKATNKALHLMFSSVSHEFRTPLNAFMNSLALIEGNYRQILNKLKFVLSKEIMLDVLPIQTIESNDKFLKIWKISSAHLLSLVEDILDLAKIEAELCNIDFPVELYLYD